MNPLNRRRLLALVGGAAIGRLRAAHADERMRRVGILAPFTGPLAEPHMAAFRERLAQLGWSEGRNLQIDGRWQTGDGLTEALARELVALSPDVIVSQSMQALRLLQAVDRTIPVVAAQVGDLVRWGMVDNPGHPAGNVTGFTLAEYSIGGKWLEWLEAIAPRTARVAYIHYPGFRGFLSAINARASDLRVEVTTAPVRNAADITAAIDAFAREPNGGLIVNPHPVTGAHGDVIIALAARHGLPAMYPYRAFVEAGGLISYGTDPVEHRRRAAGYVDLILRGARPADLPVQSPTKIELAINLRTAKALGLAVPPRLLAGADAVVQ